MPPCRVNTGGLSVFVCLWGVTRTARSQTGSKLEIERVDSRPINKDRESGRQVLGRPSRPYSSRRFFRESIAAVLVSIRSVATDPPPLRFVLAGH
jgi:hypothetical protein